jgi:hypothetical protein
VLAVGGDHLGGATVDAGDAGRDGAVRQLGGAKVGPAEQGKIVRQRRETFDREGRKKKNGLVR